MQKKKLIFGKKNSNENNKRNKKIEDQKIQSPLIIKIILQQTILFKNKHLKNR